MTSEHDSALEPQEQVLADRPDAFENPPVDFPRDAGGLALRARALGLDAFADEDPKACSGSVE